MQPNMQQVLQPQMMFQNPQMQMGNPQNQLYQVVQSNSEPTRCEKFSKWLTGSYNVPLMVFLILMGSFLLFIITIILSMFLPSGILCFSSFGNLLFALFVWGPMAIKIEKNTSTVRYGCLYVINNVFLSICCLSFPLMLNTVWNFILFETLLIAFSNKDKRMKFFCCKMSGKAVIASSIIYYLVFNWILFFHLAITVGYTLVYKRWLINKFGISNERVERYENWCLFRCLKNKFTTFVTLKDTLEKEKQSQPLMENNNMQNANNSSFIPINMYNNYYSGIVPGMQQMQPNQQNSQIELRTVDSN